jgi:hypothetical protein
LGFEVTSWPPHTTTPMMQQQQPAAAVVVPHGSREVASIGRLELVSWLNHVLQSDYTGVTDCADGVAFCQLLDAVYPGQVKLHKLNFNAQFVVGGVVYKLNLVAGP